jgi:uncharacterized protein (TIGR02186 family)
MRGRATRRLLLALALPAAAPGVAAAQPLVADLSSHLITITSNYTGTDLVLFGAVEHEGDVVVVVRGPGQPLVVRRKEQLAGVWLNRAPVRFERVPGFYALAATRPIYDIASEALLARHEIGTEHIRLETASGLDERALEPYRKAIARNLTRTGLYPEQVGKVTWLGKRLFRTEVHFPANVPAGNYSAEVYLIQEFEVTTAQTTPLFVRKRGVQRAIFDYAWAHPFWYGVFAVLLAMAAGWLAAQIFRRT